MAKLPELVCKNVKAWPDGAERIEQHHEGWLLGVDAGGIEHFIVACDRSSDWLSASVTKEQWEQAVLAKTTSVRCDVAALTEGFELPDGAQAHIPRTEYELLLSSRQAWLRVMQTLDETHPDWAAGTTQGTLVERAIKAIKNDH